ncbi:SDR family oxidoreductase [Qipengyuania sp. GH1]|uniref:SDR family NAD(P)-dependent oxidoreductase n=1 Tax=Qipengyuania aestuarii TaxID=2867241 RepID=UPI001C878AFB|nr:SDR family oxidoreductase [Qipengyuania aestuarii]MBX7535174.1 SDR family oxidoreductase [Qipengyuania aestuarii]
MRSRFQDQVVLVTGATGGLGRALADAFAAEGARVAIAARREAEGRALAEKIGRRALFVPLEVEDETSWANALAATENQLGPVSVLINNAAHIAIGGVEAVPLQEWRKVLDANLTGPLLGIRAVAPSMRRAGGGSIVNVSSIAGLHVTPGMAAYGASKWGLRSVTLTAAHELARYNIRVNAVHPGIIDTPLAYDPGSGEELVPVVDFAIPRMASAAEIARYVLFVASDEAGFSTGSEFVADGGYGLGPVN